MLKQLKSALLVLALGAATSSLQAATYNGDLIVGFTKQSGMDLVYDIGPASALTNGQNWNLSALLSGFDLGTVRWGIIGDANGAPRVAWMTTDGIIPPTIASNAKWGQLDTATKSIYQFFTTAGAGQSLSIDASDDNSWNNQAISGSLLTAYHNVYLDPTVTGQSTAVFFKVLANNTDPVQIGNFTLAANGVLTFTTNSATAVVPAPPVLSIIRVGTTSTISFLTTNGATYKLYFTNTAGLTSTVTNWPSSATTVSGNNATNSINDITTDSDRFYRVMAY